MVRITVILLCLALASAMGALAPPAGAQTPVPRVTIDDAVALALRENRSLRAKQFEHQATRAGEITAGLRPNPVGTYSADHLGARNVDREYAVSVGQPIELGGKRERRLDSARAATRVSELELADVQRQIVAQVKRTFADALVARATQALAQDNLRALDDIERIQRFRAERGDISELELTRIQIQRFAFERDAADAGQAIQSARIGLRALSGLDGLPSEFEIAGDLEFRDRPFDREALYRITMANRPDVRAAEAARDKARADVDLARANAWWDVTPQVEYRRVGPDSTIGIGVSVPIRIFDRNQGEIARTRAEVQRSDALRQASAVQALADVDAALAAVVTSRDKVILLRDTYLPKAQRARETVEFAYRRGGVSLLDYLDAQRTYRETALEHIRTVGAYLGAVYQLETAVGGSLQP
ncbi:MAG TPA: TolC family protein [Candidatus Acidoferrum sp.]|nr:TolC family protein [Candidatus Acidoferrum sp.]